MRDIKVIMRFCRRCGAPLKTAGGPYAFVCTNSHKIFYNAAPATGLVLLDQKGRFLLIERGIHPGKGMLDAPGGFCDGPETLEQSVVRETQEEIGLTPAMYTAPRFVVNCIDPYDFDDETLAVSATIFAARLLPGAKPVASDDAAAILFVDPQGVDLDKIYFPSIRSAIEALRADPSLAG